MAPVNYIAKSACFSNGVSILRLHILEYFIMSVKIYIFGCRSLISWSYATATHSHYNSYSTEFIYFTWEPQLHIPLLLPLLITPRLNLFRLLSRSFLPSIPISLHSWSYMVHVGSIPGRGKRCFFTSQRLDLLWCPTSLQSNGYRGFFPCG
jgi:hypothetical protein